jgi:XTP/dITP diphosphohydrolase
VLWGFKVMSLWRDRTLVLATHNKGKIAEIMAYLAPLHLNVLTSLDVEVPEPIETETTFEGNAALKARAAMMATGHAALADDSGVMIEALDGAPGAYSADWAGPEKDFTKAMQRVEDLMRGVQNTKACFVTVMALCDTNGAIHTTRGEIHGHICFPTRGEYGFGYDPIFIPEGETRSFGEMSRDEKAQFSHRIRALQLMLDYMSQ